MVAPQVHREKPPLPRPTSGGFSGTATLIGAARRRADYLKPQENSILLPLSKFERVEKAFRFRPK